VSSCLSTGAADAACLEQNGYSGALRNKYVAHGWLDRLARGVYCRPIPVDAAKAMTWEGVVVSLQTLQKAKFVVGGRRAREVQGFSHYLSSAPQRKVHLYGTGTQPGFAS
jgi:Transcriptional regulator, AbiEi antitoxin N-terminal domain